MLYTVPLSIIKKIYLKELGKISKLCGLLMMKTADKSVCTLENEHISCFACFFVQKILDTCLPSIFLISMRQLPPQYLSEVKIIKGKKKILLRQENCVLEHSGSITSFPLLLLSFVILSKFFLCIVFPHIHIMFSNTFFFHLS